jgi:hypothetical protein
VERCLSIMASAKKLFLTCYLHWLGAAKENKVFLSVDLVVRRDIPWDKSIPSRTHEYHVDASQSISEGPIFCMSERVDAMAWI